VRASVHADAPYVLRSSSRIALSRRLTCVLLTPSTYPISTCTSSSFKRNSVIPDRAAPDIQTIDSRGTGQEVDGRAVTLQVSITRLSRGARLWRSRRWLRCLVLVRGGCGRGRRRLVRCGSEAFDPTEGLCALARTSCRRDG